MNGLQAEKMIGMLTEIRDELKLMNEMTRVAVDRQGVLYEAHMRQQRLQEVVDHAVSAFWKYETANRAAHVAAQDLAARLSKEEGS